MIIIFILCVLTLRPAGSQKVQQLQKVQPQKFDTEMIELRARIEQLEKELELMKKIIQIRGANVEINTGGNIKMRASTISVEAGLKAEMKGTMVTVQASNTNIIKGSLVRIN